MLQSPLPSLSLVAPFAIAVLLPLSEETANAQDPTPVLAAGAVSPAAPRHSEILDKPAKLEVNGIPLEAAFDALEASAGVRIAYSPSLLPKDRLVTCLCHDATIRDAIDELLEGTRLELLVAGSQIVIRQQKRLLRPKLASQTTGRTGDFIAASMQQRTRARSANTRGLHSANSTRQGSILVQVSDAESAEPLAGVSVSVRETNIGQLTDQNGSALLVNVPEGTHTVVAQRIGYEQAEQANVAVSEGETTTVDIHMTSSAVALDEVVVVGYGEQVAANITGSVSRANSEDMARAATPTVGQSLQGQTPGVFIKNLNAQPGENKVDINIRGFGEPLIIVDGFPVEGHVFNDLDVNDIDDLVVLKDAAAAAVYGARAGNGVILITTKRGALSAPQFQYRSQFAREFFLPGAVPEDMAASYEYMEHWNRRNEARGEPLRFSEERVTLSREHADGSEPELYPNTNMFDLVLRDDAPMSQHALSVTGGSESVRYRISGGWLNQAGMLQSNDIDFDRYNLRSNLDVALTDRLDLGLDLAFTSREYLGPYNQLEGDGFSVIGNQSNADPIYTRLFRWRPFWSTEPLPDGRPRAGGTGGSSNPWNAMWMELGGSREYTDQLADAKVSLSYGLPFGLTAGADFNVARQLLDFEMFQKHLQEWTYDCDGGACAYNLVREPNPWTEVRERRDTRNDWAQR